MPKHSMCWTRIAIVMAVGLTLTVGAQPASAQESRQQFSDTIHVVQRKPVLQKGRFDLVPRFGMSINDSMYRSFKIGVNGNYHVSERLYVGGLFEWYNFGGILGGPTSNFKDVNTQTRTTADASYLNWAGGLEVGFVPLAGKFALFNRAILFYDLAITAGGVYADASTIALPASQSGVGGTLSVTNRIFFNRWMAANFEVRDVLYTARLRGQQDKSLAHSVTASVGLSMYFPTTFRYSDEDDQD
jgi:outer membrane beta-barrel protein